MPKFELTSNFQPTGDQPEAINKLIDGLGKGYRNQVLLGATGTGKSLGYDDPLFIIENETPRIIPIGQMIDDLFAQANHPSRCIGNTEELLASEGKYYAQAFNPQTGHIGLYPIRSFIRHATPNKMYHLQTACGRNATFTGDHNLWVLRNGKLKLIKTSEALTTDYVPLPEKLMAHGDLLSLNTIEILKDKRLFVDAKEQILSYIETHGDDKFRTVMTESGVSSISKIFAMRHNTRGRGIEVNTFQQVLEKTDSLAGNWNPIEATVGGKLTHDRLPTELSLTPAVLQLIGYYIAEGNSQRGYFILANRDQTIRQHIESALNQIGVPFAVRPSSDYQISSTALTTLLSRLCGNTAHDKHLPDFWLSLSETNLSFMLRAYFDGDGYVGRASDVSATTASSRLASDLTFALLRFSIWARISRRYKRATNSSHAGDWYYQITISGQENLRHFHNKVGFSLERKQKALEAQMHHNEHSNVDLAPIDGKQLRFLRTTLQLTAEELGKRSDISRSAIQLFENNERSPRRIVLLKILAALENEAKHFQILPEEWQMVWQQLRQLCNLHWTRIASVQKANYRRPFVYDISVPQAETFLAGSGGFFVHNTFTIANIIQEVQRPTLIMAHNKTLAAQLYAEFKDFFPKNAVEYFVSYYDYYQPEAYVAKHDLFIEKETEINEEIERLRLAATTAMMSRKDVIIVASVSCIYGLGSPEAFGKAVIELKTGEAIRRNTLLRRLVEIHYTRNDTELKLGTFRVRGDTLEVRPSYEEKIHRIDFFGDDIERMLEIDDVTGEVLNTRDELSIYPARHFITEEEKMRKAISDIEAELEERVKYFQAQEMYLEAQRIEQRARYDLEMLKEVGYCSGIENYSRHMDQRAPGSPPWTLVDYFPPDYLLVLDESHMTVPQIRGMYGGDRSRKEVLVQYGFRLPSAIDNRPLNFSEFESRMGQTIYTSATPGPYEMEHTQQVVQQIIRPTGLIDPEVEIRKTEGQIDNLVKEIRQRLEQGERVLVTTLTKKMAEKLADYILELGIKVHYLHSEVETLDRIGILRDLRLGVFDVVVGINLLREGLDLPEVSLVAILDADKEGFLRSGTSLLQTIGRAARHLHGKVIMYADKMTDSMKFAISETNRRREIQKKYNDDHGIVPASIVKSVRDLTMRVKVSEERAEYTASPAQLPKADLARMIKELEKQMKESAQNLEFEKAAMLRDQIFDLRQTMADKENVPEWEKFKLLTEDVD